MTDRKRLVFWGPGHIGGAALREVLKSPDRFDVVGARVYSPDKHGRDVASSLASADWGDRYDRDRRDLVPGRRLRRVHALPLDHDQVTGMHWRYSDPARTS